MAKTSMVNRDLKRAKLIEKYAAKRAALKAIVSEPHCLLRGEDGGADRFAEIAT